MKIKIKMRDKKLAKNKVCKAYIKQLEKVLNSEEHQRRLDQDMIDLMTYGYIVKGNEIIKLEAKEFKSKNNTKTS